MVTEAKTQAAESKYVDLDNMPSMDELLQGTVKSDFVEGSIIPGTIVEKRNDGALVDIGYKAEGFVPAGEFSKWNDVKVGDTIDVFLEEIENENSMPGISLSKACAIKAWNRITDECGEGSVVKGLMKHRVKGGIIVDIDGVEAFLPGSQIDIGPVRNMDDFIGKEFDVKILKINSERRNIVVSRRELLEESLRDRRSNLLKEMEIGQLRSGVVKNITDFGAFIDLGGVDGLLHITDMSWGRISHPSELLEVGQPVEVVILDIDYNKERVSLGYKQKSQNPWEAVEEKYPVGSRVKGRVVNIMPYGAFVEIEDGVEGLIHVSEMSWSQHLRSAQDFMKVGDEVEAVVLTLDREERKMSLGIKQLKQDPWETIEEKYPVGSKHTAKVRNFTNFGVFVEIEEGVDGLIHISDLSWTKKVKHPSEFTQIGADIEVQVLEIDKENRRLSLGHKQLEENPWDVFETVFTVGSVHEGTIIEMLDKGAVVALPYGVEGFATPKHLVKEDGSQAQLDEKLEFKVIEFNKDAKRIILSHSRIFEDVAKAEERAEKKAASGAKKSSSSNKREDSPMIQNQAASTTLGDIDALAALKEQLEGKK